MDQGPLVIEEIDAGGRFLEEFVKTVPVLAAFWLRANEGDAGYLYVASDQINDDNIKEVYGEVGRIAGEMRDPNFDPFRVKLIKRSDPLTGAAMQYLERFPGRIPTRLRQRNFGRIGTEEVYIYPSTVTVQ
jgi:hypothetical protein